MLVLSRKEGERIVIGPDIVISVVAVQGGRVKLGISAPSEVPIHREEVRDRAIRHEATLARPASWHATESTYYAEFA